MKCDHYFYQCSKEYLDSIDTKLYEEIVEVVGKLPKRQTQAEINRDFFWLLTDRNWSYDTIPGGLLEKSPEDIEVKSISLAERKKARRSDLCRTTTTIDAMWKADFGKCFKDKLVQIEVQFGQVESMFKDFCGFRIARYERRLALGIEIVISEPNVYFSHRRESISGMAYFDIAKKTLPSICLDCPIWLIGIKQ
jgi:hypothetical protein